MRVAASGAAGIAALIAAASAFTCDFITD